MEANLHEETARDALRARLDADLGPGEHAPVPHGPERDRSVWRFGGVTVTLETYPSAPGETGLDAVAARLAELGVPVERIEETDWG